MSKELKFTNFDRLPSYNHHKTLKALIYKALNLEWGSRGRKFESSHPDVPEALKIKASGFFVARYTLLRIVINCQKRRSTPIITPIIF